MVFGRKSNESDKDKAKWFKDEARRRKAAAALLDSLGDKRGAKRAQRTEKLQREAAEKLNRRGQKE